MVNMGKLKQILSLSATRKCESVSILAVLLQDERLLAAHRTAVQKVLTLIEKEYAITRVKDGIWIRKTENLIFSIFEHVDTRP